MTILQNPIEETNQFDKKQNPGQIGMTEESRIIFDFASQGFSSGKKEITVLLRAQLHF